MNTAQSADGTMIAFDRHGDGPALILIDGALCHRSSGSKSQLVSLLAEHCTVFSYDRRGRGESGDASDGGRSPGAREREIEDIAALVGEAGGSAHLYGHSSGACLAIEAALVLGDRVRSLTLYEAPYNDDPANQPVWQRYLADLTEALEDGRGGDAVTLFMASVGIPASQIAGMRQSPNWGDFEAIGPTLAYDHLAVIGPDQAVPIERLAAVMVPVLVMFGSASFAFMRTTAQTLSQAFPAGQLCRLEGQTHNVDPDVVAPEMVAFLIP